MPFHQHQATTVQSIEEEEEEEEIAHGAQEEEVSADRQRP